MGDALASIVSLMLLIGPPATAAAERPKGPLWQKPYAGEEATGENVIALWNFSCGAEGQDRSGHGHGLTLRGQTRFVEGGRFGGCLESFPAGKENDRPQGALRPLSGQTFSSRAIGAQRRRTRIKPLFRIALPSCARNWRAPTAGTQIPQIRTWSYDSAGSAARITSFW